MRKRGDTKMLVGDVIKQWIVDNPGMSRRDLAKKMGVNIGSVSKLEHGSIKKPGVPLLASLAEATGVSLSLIIALAYPQTRDKLVAVPPELMPLLMKLATMSPDRRDAALKLFGGD